MAPQPKRGDVQWVVFDIGGVLLDWRPELVYAELIPDAAQRTWFLAEVCTPEWNLSLDAGRSFDAACAELATRYPAQERNIHAWKRQADMVAGEIPGTADLVSALRSRGTPCTSSRTCHRMSFATVSTNMTFSGASTEHWCRETSAS